MSTPGTVYGRLASEDGGDWWRIEATGDPSEPIGLIVKCVATQFSADEVMVLADALLGAARATRHTERREVHDDERQGPTVPG